MVYRASQPRTGASLVETAIVFPVVFILLIILVVGSMGILRYQEVAWLAREGARYASVRGASYGREVANSTPATAEDVYNKVIKPKAVALDLSKLSYSVTWSSSNAPYAVTDDYGTPRGNTVTVSVSYQWFPEMYLVGPITFTSSSTLPMSY